MADWILTTDRLPESGAAPYQCEPVIARVSAAGDDGEDRVYCWQAIRCADHDGVVRWYGLANDGRCVKDRPAYEELIDESVLAWVPWPDFAITKQEQALIASRQAASVHRGQSDG
jgi:hypothetical protein